MANTITVLPNARRNVFGTGVIPIPAKLTLGVRFDPRWEKLIQSYGKASVAPHFRAALQDVGRYLTKRMRDEYIRQHRGWGTANPDPTSAPGLGNLLRYRTQLKSDGGILRVGYIGALGGTGVDPLSRNFYRRYYMAQERGQRPQRQLERGYTILAGKLGYLINRLEQSSLLSQRGSAVGRMFQVSDTARLQEVIHEQMSKNFLFARLMNWARRLGQDEVSAAKTALHMYKKVVMEGTNPHPAYYAVINPSPTGNSIQGMFINQGDASQVKGIFTRAFHKAVEQLRV